MVEEGNALAIFEGRKIRKLWHEDEWWFSVVDIAGALTDSENPNRYWSDLKIKLNQEGSQLYDFIVQLKLSASDGKYYETDCTNTEGAFRLIQSIPSPKAEPFKLWLAKVGYERVQEIENPELAQNRAKKYYELKGYPPSWINLRLRSIDIRNDLTDEWKERSVKEGKEFAILTNEIHKASFDISAAEHKEIKELDPKRKNQNLRDHMSNLELVFTMLGEASTKEIASAHDAQGFDENKVAANKGGSIAGGARKKLEAVTKRKVVTPKTPLKKIEGNKK